MEQDWEEEEEEGTLSKNLANLYKLFLSRASFFYTSLCNVTIKNDIMTNSYHSCFSINLFPPIGFPNQERKSLSSW